MCLCSKFKKLYSANGLNQGRPVQLIKAAPTQVMIKKTPQMGVKNGKYK